MMSQMLQAVSANLGAYPAISLILFFVVFVGMLAMVLRMKRTHIEHMGALPLDNAEQGDVTHG
ncbi:cbb3-type cytochrome c oxidase subunit 3 [bacterium]|nr:cbb3-type cytochrome c oxidase subunit 3 [bacterium]